MPESVNVTGAERTSFSSMVEKLRVLSAIRFSPMPSRVRDTIIGRTTSAWRAPECRLFRSIPASNSRGIRRSGVRRSAQEYTAKHYHRPSDEYSPSMDFSTDSELAKFGFVLGWQALVGNDKGSWVPGDEFESVRVRCRRKLSTNAGR